MSEKQNYEVGVSKMEEADKTSTNDILSEGYLEKGLPSDISKDLTIVEDGDIALSRKIHLINNAIDEIGFTWFHVQLFCIAGFGYSVDSQMEMVQSAVKTYVDYQMKGGGTQ